MNDKDFLATVDTKISQLLSQKKSVMDRLMDGKWHAQEVHNALDDALKQVTSLEEEVRYDALVSVTEQIPKFVLSVWSTAIQEVQAIEKECERWTEMKRLYSDFLEAQKEKAQNDQELAQNIDSGKIEEPSAKTGMRRPAGTRPPVTLKDYRNMNADLQQTKRNDADDSEG